MTTPSEQRRAASAATASETATQNSANVATNTATNAGVSALLGTLPGPLSSAATALSEGISAAIKTSSAQAKSVPSTSPGLADPTKIFAAQLAYAIITAIWCFIKSILNPLPIIGMFFPLCSEEDRLRNVTALANANITQNTPVVPSSNVQPSTTQNQIDQVTTAGISFEQFLATHNQAEVDRIASLPRQTTPPQQTVSESGAPTPVAPSIQEIGRSANAGSENLATTNTDIRKLFGL